MASYNARRRASLEAKIEQKNLEKWVEEQERGIEEGIARALDGYVEHMHRE